MLKVIDNKDVTQKVVLLRLDLNMPVDSKGDITDTSRLEHSLPTIKLLRQNNAKIVILSHRGRPKANYNEHDTLKHTITVIEKYINEHVMFLGTHFKDDFPTRSMLDAADVFLLENLRFSKGEIENSTTFAHQLASLGDIYVNDAFSVSHRSHASVEAITHYLPSYAGLALHKEVTALSFLNNAQLSRSMVIVAGAKISTKISILKNLVPKVNTLFIGGAMANNFLKVQGYSIGQSLYEEAYLHFAEEIFEDAKIHNTELLLPKDVMVADDVNALQGEKRILTRNDISDTEMIFDIGSLTVRSICDAVCNSQLVLWNGPLGLIEREFFAKSSIDVAHFIAQHIIEDKEFKAVAGGGDTNLVLQKAGVKDNFSYVSNAGGAFLEWLEGKYLPGIKALETCNYTK